jgi:hypothetical protein
MRVQSVSGSCATCIEDHNYWTTRTAGYIGAASGEAVGSAARRGPHLSRNAWGAGLRHEAECLSDSEVVAIIENVPRARGARLVVGAS